MKRMMLFLMVCCLIGLAQALSITNGDFEADAGAGSIEAVTDWYYDTSANFWESA